MAESEMGDPIHAERNRIADEFLFRCSLSTFSTLQPLLRPRSTSLRYEPNPMSSRTKKEVTP
jgi:hypothetical protein